MLKAKQFEALVLKEICDTGNVKPTTAVLMITALKELERRDIESAKKVTLFRRYGVE